MKPTQEQIELAAAAIANVRAGRRGMLAVTNVLDLLDAVSPKLKREVFEDAEAALEAAGIAELSEALAKSVKLQSHYANLLNMHDGGQRIIFHDAQEWIARLKHLREHQQ